MKKLMALVLLLGSVQAFAVPVQWTLQDVMLGTGMAVTGSFIRILQGESNALVR